MYVEYIQRDSVNTLLYLCIANLGEEKLFSSLSVLSRKNSCFPNIKFNYFAFEFPAAVVPPSEFLKSKEK